MTARLTPEQLAVNRAKDRRRNRGRTFVGERRVWTHIKSRCYNTNTPDYPRYGGRGITMCKQWKDGFQAFLDDMGPRPEGHSIDRIDVDGPYCRENCRWATATEQQRNKRNNVTDTIDGVEMCLAEIAEKAGLQRGTVWSRYKSGWRGKDLLLPLQSNQYARIRGAA